MTGFFSELECSDETLTMPPIIKHVVCGRCLSFDDNIHRALRRYQGHCTRISISNQVWSTGPVFAVPSSAAAFSLLILSLSSSSGLLPFDL